MTACSTFCPRWASAVSFIFCRIEGGNLRGRIGLAVRPSTQASPFGRLGRSCRGPASCPSPPSDRHSGGRQGVLTAKKVRSGLVHRLALAGWPTRRSPSSLKATMDGVVRMPSAVLDDFRGSCLPITATHEFVVPRSIPMTFSHGPHILLFAAGWLGPDGATNPNPPKQSHTRDIATVEPHIGGGGRACKEGGRNLRPAKKPQP